MVNKMDMVTGILTVIPMVIHMDIIIYINNIHTIKKDVVQKISKTFKRFAVVVHLSKLTDPPELLQIKGINQVQYSIRNNFNYQCN